LGEFHLIMEFMALNSTRYDKCHIFKFMVSGSYSVQENWVVLDCESHCNMDFMLILFFIANNLDNVS